MSTRSPQSERAPAGRDDGGVRGSRDHEAASAEFRAALSVLQESPFLGQQALQPSEHGLKQVLDALPAAIYTTDAEGRLTYFNPAAVAFSGREPELGTDQWCVSFRLYHPDGTPMAHDQCPMAVSLREGRAIRGELAIAERPDGTRVWFEPFPTPLRDAAGKVVGGLNMLLDVTQRERAGQALRDSEERFRAIVSQATTGVAQTDMAGRFTLVNPRYCEIVGYTAEELQQLRMQDITHPDDLPLNLEQFRRLANGGPDFVIEKRYVRKDGSVVWVNNSVGAVRDARGHPQSVVAVVLDITERKRAEDALRRSEKELADFFDTASIGLHWVGPDGIIQRVNQAELDMLGYSREEYVGCHIADFHADQEVIEDILACLKRGERLHEYPARLRCKDGSIRDVLINSSALFENGRFVHTRCFTTDVTARKQAERAVQESEESFRAFFAASSDVVYRMSADWTEMRHLRGRDFIADTEEASRTWLDKYIPLDDQARVIEAIKEAIRTRSIFQLEHRVRRVDGSLGWTFSRAIPILDENGAVLEWFGVASDVTRRRQAEEALRAAERMEAVGQLAGGVAHEANNQMTVVLGCAEFALRRPDLPYELRQELLSIRRAGERTAAITAQLLAFGRRQLLRPEPVDLNAVAESFAPILQRTLGEKNELVCNLSSELKPVLADRGQIEQVLVNLTLNARDAMPDGGRLTLETRPASVTELRPSSSREEPLPPGSYGVLTVRDTGHGMTADVLARIFEPFFTTKPLGEGSGLGLSTVYGIVRQLGGDIHVESIPGTGTTFEIYFPLALKVVDAPERPAPKSPKLSVGKVLVVEDEPVVRALAVRALRAEGFEVLEAEHGGAALELLTHHPAPVHAVVSDVAMPVLGGRELVERLARSHPGVPVLLMSGYTADELVRRGMLPSGTGWLLSKPFDPSTLVERVRAMVDQVRPASH